MLTYQYYSAASAAIQNKIQMMTTMHSNSTQIAKQQIYTKQMQQNYL